MSGADATGRSPTAAEQARRRRLREQVFGEVLPDTTADERDTDGPGSAGTSNDEWLRSNVPPHHG